MPAAKLGGILAFVLFTTGALAQVEPQDPLGRFIADFFRQHDGKTVCVEDELTSMAQIRATLAEHFKGVDQSRGLSPKDVAIALWTRYPCPFSPFRAELRPATAGDIEGVWLFPESSQKYRYGPRSTRTPPFGPNSRFVCDAVGYYPGGELRHAIISGQVQCPFGKASDMDVARKNPLVATWSMPRDGRIGVKRTDVQNHVEEWDVYVVTQAFTFRELALQPGELVAYARRENGNEVNAATQFRHLRRLP